MWRWLVGGSGWKWKEMLEVKGLEVEEDGW